ncbi:MAG: tetratricopeptide repeat protein [Elusimicrobia bacterium]|nr:tetratricopeptide repeat protein [Elusimicrobiota bacterium]
MRLLLPTLLLLAAPLCAQAPSAAPSRSSGTEEAQAAELYETGKYPQAISLYENLLARFPRSPELHYNLGNCYFKNGKLAPAILHYQQAYHLNPRDADARFNLEFALKRAGETLVPEGVPQPLHRLWTSLSLGELRGAFLFVYWVLALWLAIFLWRPQLPGLRRSLSRQTLAGLGVLGIFLGLWWGIRKHQPQPHGVIAEADATVHSGPRKNFPASFTLPEGRRVQILDPRNGWLEIGVPQEGLKGWIPQEKVLRIP